MGDLPRRVPGRPGRQFGLFQQDHIGPAFMRQMVGQAAAHHAAADDDGLGVLGQTLLPGCSAVLAISVFLR
jgi:hypothetical protein